MSLKKKKRIHYIDRLRGLAVLTMFFVHPAVAWMTAEAKETVYFTLSMKISGIVAPTFLFLAGISIALIADSDHRRNRPLLELQYRVAKRGLQILLIGYGFHLFSYVTSGFSGHWIRIFKVDVLNCIGLCLMLFPWIAWPKRAFNVAALILFLFLPFVSLITYRLPIDEYLPAVLAGYFKTDSRLAQFPIIPYGAWIALGLFVGPIWTASRRSPKEENRFWIGIAALSIIMWVVGNYLHGVYYHFSLNELGVDKPQRKGLPHGFWMKGAFVMGLFVLSRLTESLFNRIGQKEILLLFGKTSLFGYCVHLLIIYNVFGRYLGRRLNVVEHAISSIGLAVLMYFLTLLWIQIKNDRFKLPFLKFSAK